MKANRYVELLCGSFEEQFDLVPFYAFFHCHIIGPARGFPWHFHAGLQFGPWYIDLRIGPDGGYEGA
jgi:hypothetical protein